MWYAGGVSTLRRFHFSGVLDPGSLDVDALRSEILLYHAQPGSGTDSSAPKGHMHKTSHQAAESHVCGVCCKSLSTKEGLRRHVHSVHLGMDSRINLSYSYIYIRKDGKKVIPRFL